MAIRNIRNDKDEILRKRSKEVEEIDNKIRQLVLDMLDTMYHYDGVGLAAPQVGILKRIVVYDVGDGPKVMINPVISKTSGSQTNEEGCLSFPNLFGLVDRPETLSIEAFDLDGNKIKIKAKELEAVVISHETDHLDGIVFTDKAYDMYMATPEEIEAARKEQSKSQQNKSRSSGNKKNKSKKIV